MSEETGTRAATIAGFVLAGGLSSRMGTDKALVTVGGRPLVALAIKTLMNAGLEPAIAGARSNLSTYAPVLGDESPDLGPLGGVCSALAWTALEWSVFLSVDQPLIPSSLIRYLAWCAQVTDEPVVLCSVNGFPQTFPVAIHKRTLLTLRLQLREGNRGCLAAFRSAAEREGKPLTVLSTEYLVQAGHVQDSQGHVAGRWFSNLNTPGDLKRISGTIA